MLEEYFSIKVDGEEQTLETLPAIIPGHSTIVLERLPTFMLRLGSEVDWERERECFEGIAKELALLHVPFFEGESDEGQEPEQKDPGADSEKLTRVMTQAWLPSMRCYQPSKDLIANKAVVQVASLPSLYSVFERC